MVPDKVVSGTNESAPLNVEHRTNPAAGILGVISLITGVGIFVTRRKADEPVEKYAVKLEPISGLSRPATNFVFNLSF